MQVNKIHGKNTINNILLSMRKIAINGVHHLDQGRVISMLVNIWGGDSGEDNTDLHPNDRI